MTKNTIISAHKALDEFATFYRSFGMKIVGGSGRLVGHPAGRLAPGNIVGAKSRIEQLGDVRVQEETGVFRYWAVNEPGKVFELEAR